MQRGSSPPPPADALHGGGGSRLLRLRRGDGPGYFMLAEGSNAVFELQKFEDAVPRCLVRPLATVRAGGDVASAAR